MNKTIIGIIAVVLVAGGAYYLWGQSNNKNGMPDMSSGDMKNMGQGDDTSSSMLAEDNAVIVSDQRPGTSVVGTAVLAAPGFLVIHEDTAGQPGAVLGASALLSAGESRGINIKLSRPMKDGETLHAMLHTDVDQNGTFNASTDTLVQSRLGGPIHGTFQVSSKANPDAPVSI